MVKMKSKKSWIRIFESVISLLIILFALIFFISNQTVKISDEEKAREILIIILYNIETNETTRNFVINNDTSNLNYSISNQINSISPNYNFSFCITLPYLTCKNFYPYELPPKKEIFSDSILISYIYNNQVNSTKLVLYIWKK